MPVPGQTPNKPADSSGKVQKQSEESQPNGPPSVSAIPENSARPTQRNADKPSPEDDHNSVTVRKLPTVSIGKDWADWSYWGFGGILVIVGSLQVALLFGTMRSMQKQVRAQMDATNPLIVVVPHNEVESGDLLLFDWDASNVGLTAAFITEFSTRFVFYSSDDLIPAIPDYGNPYRPHLSPLLPNKIEPGDGVGLTGMPYENPKELWESFSKTKVNWVLYAYGYVKYRDIYKRLHETGYGFRYYPEVGKFEPSGPDGYNYFT